MGDDDCTGTKSDLAKEFKHTKTDIWEVYEQIPTGKIGAIIPGISKPFRNLELIKDLPFVWRMVRDVIKIKSCWYYLCLFTLVKLLSSLEPAAALWCVIIRVIYIPDRPDLRRLGSPATTSPSSVLARTPLTSPDRSYRSK